MHGRDVKCQRCSEVATVHMTEMTGSELRECHFCYDHAREEGVAEQAESWPDDDFHTTLEVTTKQLRDSEGLFARFPDGVCVDMSGLHLSRDCVFVKIEPVEGSQERGVRFVRIKVVAENTKEGS